MSARWPRSRRGFTLFEAVIVLCILGVFIYMGAGSLLSLAPKYRLESAVWDVRSAMAAARYRAIYENASVRIRFIGTGWEAEKYDPADGVWKICGKRTLDGVRVEANNTPTFTGQGTVTGLATITVSNSLGAYKLTLAITGRVRTTRIL